MLQIIAKVNVAPNQQQAFIEKVEELVRRCEANEPQTLGIQWFMNDANQAIVMDTYQDSDAFLAHVSQVSELAQEISAIAPSLETLVFGSPNDTVRNLLASMGAQFFPAIAGYRR